MKQSESETQSAIIDYLTILENQGKLFSQRVNNVPIFQRDGNKSRYRALPKGTKKGFPDIIVIMNGLFIGLEVKSSIGKQSIEQKETEARLKEHGGKYYVVRSVDEVEKIIAGGLK